MSVKLLLLAILALSMSGCGQFEGKPKSRTRSPGPVFSSKAQLAASVLFDQQVRGLWVQECEAKDGKDDVGSSTQKIWKFDKDLNGEEQISSFEGNPTCNGNPDETKTQSFKYSLQEQPEGFKADFLVKLNFEKTEATTTTESADPVYEISFADDDHLSAKLDGAKTEATGFKRDRSKVARSKRAK